MTVYVEKVRAMELLEIQRQAMLMYTSCGWFFSEISGIETTQIMKYAARAMQLAKSFTDENLEEGFLSILCDDDGTLGWTCIDPFLRWRLYGCGFG